MKLRERIGVDLGRRIRLEEGIHRLSAVNVAEGVEGFVAALAFGTLDDVLAGREYLLEKARAVGIH